MERLTDTIVAPITAAGGAVAVVRVSGPRAYAVARAVFSPWPADPVPRQALYGRFAHGDDGLALPFAPGASYTGEATVELSLHGSPASVRALVESCRSAGARHAEAGEFTLRAFMNGRLDLTQAEGVRDTVAARSGAQLRQAHRLREGELRDQVHRLREALTGVLAAVEASTDFSEEVGELDRPGARDRLAKVRAGIERLLSGSEAARIVHDGLTVVIVGRPNAGKSSLLNALVGADRAIVTAQAGTTRDTVEETVEIGGMAVRLVDTAGLREASDEAERLGVARSADAAAHADLVLHVYDAAAGWHGEDDALSRVLSRPTLVVANKADLAEPSRGLAVSALAGSGLDGLRAEIEGRFAMCTEAPVVLPRHTSPLRGAAEAVDEAVATLSQPVPDDLAAVSLRAAVRHLGEITGETATPDVIERVFRDFCIGK